MLEPEALTLANKIFQAVFDCENPYTLAELKEKFAFDLTLPVAVKDFETGELTYTAAPNADKFITCQNAEAREWLRPRRTVAGLQEVLDDWTQLNTMVTERVYHSTNVHASDPIYDSVNVYGSTNCGRGKNLIYCDNSYNCDSCIACLNSGELNYCIRVNDSSACTNSYGVICSGKITNSLFIQDANNLHECMFCAHIEQREYHIANMPFEKDEYFYIKSQVVKWLLSKPA